MGDDNGLDLGCWSCSHYTRAGCLAGRNHDWRNDLGAGCPAFDYEPGSDELEHNEETNHGV